MKKVRSALVAAALGLTLAFGMASAVPAATPYNIDVIISLTGSYAFVGNQQADNFKVFEDYANRTGGIHGTPIHFVIHDDQSSPALAVQLSNQIIATHPAVVIGSDGGSLCGAMMPLFKDGPVLYCLVPSIYPPKGGFVFAAQIALNPFVNGMIRYLRMRGWNKIGIITSTDGSGLVDDTATKDSLTLPENKDVQVVQWEHFNPTDVNVNAQAVRIKNSGAQAVIVWVSGTPFGTVLRSFNDVGLSLPIETSNANSQVPQLIGYQQFLPKELVMPGPAYQMPVSVQSPQLRKATADFVAAFGADGKTPQAGSAPSVWDPSNIVLAGLRKLGTDATADQLRQYILSVHDSWGVDGNYDFRSGDQHGLSDQSVIIVRFDPQRQAFDAVSGPGGVPLRK
ncbi:MAG TPA: ABC transporter substrate-binding protein [Candidatus Lustribacter sp.]|jgi:branched-chain amino acid transport system substrate-binding protein|nr:ABC transporter substrate-binding protein [Candidatus Lustribacter sp.]